MEWRPFFVDGLTWLGYLAVVSIKTSDSFPLYDKWGILNWARDSNHSLWDLVPSARRAMIRDAAARRWRAHYQSDSILSFLDYAEFLADNLESETKGW
jgi:hypothetical protein